MLKVKVMPVSRTETRALLSSRCGSTAIGAPSGVGLIEFDRRIELGLVTVVPRSGTMELIARSLPSAQDTSAIPGGMDRFPGTAKSKSQSGEIAHEQRIQTCGRVRWNRCRADARARTCNSGPRRRRQVWRGVLAMGVVHSLGR